MKEKDIYVAIQTFHTRNTVLCHPRPVVGSCKGYQPSNPTEIHWKIRGTSDIQYLLILDVVHFDSCNIFTTANTTIFRPHQIVAHTFSNSKKAQFNIVFHTIHTHTHTQHSLLSTSSPLQSLLTPELWDSQRERERERNGSATSEERRWSWRRRYLISSQCFKIPYLSFSPSEMVFPFKPTELNSQFSI